jgi:hypothetical protein
MVSSVAPARADLTVIYATDAPPTPLVASVVCPSAMPAPEPTRDPAPPDPAPASTPTPAPSPALAVAPRPAPVEARFVRVGDGSGEAATLLLRDEHGEPAATTLDRLSILARPRGVEAPTTLTPDDPENVAPGIRRLHAALLPHLARLAAHFPGHAIEIVSGYRPGAREGSRHRFGRAIDLRVNGVPIDDVRAFLDGEPGTGLGFYPTSGFVHLDVRTQSVRWTDDSGPGQPSHVVRTEVGEPVTDVDRDAIEQALSAASAIHLDLGDLGR